MRRCFLQLAARAYRYVAADLRRTTREDGERAEAQRVLTREELLGVGHKAMGVKFILLGRLFQARRENSWLGGTLATFGAVFRAPPIE